MGAGIQPCIASSQSFKVEAAIFQVAAVQVGNFQLSTR